MADQNEKFDFMLSYTIPECTGTVHIVAETPEEAAKLFDKMNPTKLFNRSEGEDPIISEMTQFIQNPDSTLEDEMNAVGFEIDLVALKKKGYWNLVA